MHDPSDWSRRTFVAAALLGTGSVAGRLDDWLAATNGYEGVIERYGTDGDRGRPVQRGPRRRRVRPRRRPCHARHDRHVGVERPRRPRERRRQRRDFDSGEPIATHGYTFEEPGVYQVRRAPHHALGEKGAIVVE